ncbi:MAG TPA: hypothetical protein VF807_00010 [Ktedonobacterales bacterium]
MAHVLIWLIVGALCGGLGYAAGLGPRRNLGSGWRTLALSGGLGAGAALLGGVTGWLIFGRFFALPTAIWASLLLLVAGPWLTARLRGRLARGAARQGTPLPADRDA